MMNMLILCGGSGTRLANSLMIPKCLISIQGVPLLTHLIRYFMGLGVRSIGIVVPKQDEAITSFLASHFPQTVVIRQPVKDGTAGALRAAREFLTKPTLVALGDVVINGHFVSPWFERPTLVVWRNAPPHATTLNFGIGYDGEHITSIREKPTSSAGLLCGIGFYVITPELVSVILRSPIDPNTGEYGITEALEFSWANGIEFEIQQFDGMYMNVNTFEDFRGAQAIHIDILVNFC